MLVLEKLDKLIVLELVCWSPSHNRWPGHNFEREESGSRRD